jgi:VWFA-related protein
VIWRPQSAALLLAVAIGQQQPSFRSSVDAVRIDVQVTRGGRVMTGLTSTDFQLLDSGVPQHIDVVSLEQQPVDVLFVLDTSESMTGEPLARLKEAAHAAVGVLSPEDRAALLTFSHALVRRSTWGNDRAAIDAAIESTRAAGATSLQDAVFASLTMRQDARGRMLALLFSDGMDTVSWLPALRVLAQAQRTDTVFDVVSLPERTSPRAPPPLSPSVMRRWFLEEPLLFRQQFLSVLSEDTGGDRFVASDANLRDTFVRVVTLFKSRYVLSYAPKGVPEGGWHPVDVRLTRGAADIRARRGYQR